MKKILFNSFIALSFFSSINTIQAQCSFNIVGTTSVSPTSPLSDMAVAPNNKVYTIAYNTTTNNIQLKSAFTASSSWTLDATITTTTTVKPVIKIRNDGKIYVFINDGIANVGKVYSSTGGTLTQVGAAVSTGSVSDLSIAFNSIGEEFVAYSDIANSNRSTVKKLSGGIWINVGTTGIASTNSAFFNSLILDNTDNPVIAFRDFASGYKIVVMKLSGSNWVPVTGTGTVSVGAATNSVLKVASNGNYYLGYTEGSNVIVQLYNGTTWSALGSPVTSMLSTANTFDLDLDPVDVPYFTCIQNTSYYPTAYKYTGVPTWTTVSIGYINSSTNNTNATIDIDNAGTPYFSYVDVFANNDLSVKTLASPITISSQPLATQTICNGSAGSFSVGVVGGVPTYQWQSSTGGAFANAGAPYTNASTNILSFTANPGINQNKLRCVVNVGCKNSISNTSTLTVSSPSVSLITTNPSCFGSANGSITSIVSGGITPYTYSWNSGDITANIFSKPAGTYSVTATDASGCPASASANLISPSAISSSILGGLTICNGGNTTLTLTAAGGTPGYTYSWTPGASLSSTTGPVVVAMPTITTTYTGTVTDANACVKSTTVTITVNVLPAVSAGPDNSICLGGSTMNSATGAHTYTWNPGAYVGANQLVTPLSTTVYTVVGTNTLTGCTNSDSRTVTVNPNPTVNAISSPTSICAGSTATLTASGAVSYTWVPGSLTGANIVVTPTASTIYTVTGSTAAGCTNTKTLSLTVNSNPTVAAFSSPTAICVGSTATLTASGALSYTWNPGAITSASVVVTPTTTTNYTVTGTTGGCSNTKTLSLIVNPNPVATASNSGPLTCTTVTVALNSGFAAGATYLWTGPSFTSTSQNTSANLPGNYTVTVTNSGTGCSSSAVTSVIQNTTPPATTVTTTGTITCITSTVNLNSSLAGMTYSWTAPGGGSVSSSNTQNTIGSGAGTYSLTVVNPSNGCSYLTTTSVSQNTTMPTGVSAGPNQMITCTNSVVSLNGSISSPTNAIVNWTGANVCGSPTNITTAACSGGIYTLTATHPLTGCYVTSTVSVFVDVSSPTVTLSSSSLTLTCAAPTTSVSVSSIPSSNVVYSWTPSGPSFSTPGTYSLVVTNTINGCSTSNSANVVSVFQDQSIPTVSLSSNSGTLTCLITSIMVTSTVSPSSGVIFAWSPSAGISSPTNQSNATFTASGTYSLVVTNTVNGCASSPNTFMVLTDNVSPSITISGNTNICKGSTTNLTASGATSYTWDSGANTTSISVSPTITTTYTVIGENGNGCLSSLTAMVSIISSKSITGVITNTNGATGGDVILYKYTAALSQWDSVTVTPLTSSYTFNNIDSALYVVRAIPTATNIQVTYGASSISWQNATVITHGCTSNTSQNITLIGLTPFILGPGVLTGTITEASGFGQRLSSEFKPLAPGQPIGGIIVKGGRNPGGQMMVQTTTDATGQYTLSGLPLNSGDKYFVFVDVPGLDTNGTYHLVIAAGNTQIDGLNFTIDSVYINPIGSVAAVSQENSILDNKILMFPNPAKHYVSIQYELIQSASVQIDLYDIIGNKVKTITEVNRHEKNKYNHKVNLDDLSSGVYFVKLKINNSETVIKLVITD